ncbi:MAG: phytanoyl-CoA dioxygenase family protein [Acidimicrobiia bacterium]|nr:phytanoyl-CoA dioxygenase family protein [Acidimicrobiia bacterium]
MLTRRGGYLRLREDAPVASAQLQREGYVVLAEVFDGDAVAELRADIDRVFRDHAPDVRNDRYEPVHWSAFRYEMLNRSEPCQRAVGERAILDVVEPLLGEDCHVIANTAWRQPAGEPSTHGGQNWHLDAGPHVPRPPEVPWDERIPYPVFAVACHILLADSDLDCGPTAVIPRSHTSGQAPPADRRADVELTWQGTPALPLVGRAGDVLVFVSDIWHRRLPSAPDHPGRYFLQVHYGRRDLAQRLRPAGELQQSPEAIARARTERDRTLIGLHAPFFYDG